MLHSIIRGCGLFQICGDIGIVGVCFHSRWKKYLSLISAVWYITVNVERTSSINHLSLHLKDRDRQSAGFLSVTQQMLGTLQWRRFVCHFRASFSETLWGNVMFISSQTFSPRDKSQNRGEQSKGLKAVRVSMGAAGRLHRWGGVAHHRVVVRWRTVTLQARVQGWVIQTEVQRADRWWELFLHWVTQHRLFALTHCLHPEKHKETENY